MYTQAVSSSVNCKLTPSSGDFTHTPYLSTMCTQKLFKFNKNKTDMDDKTKVSLLYTLVGGVLGIFSAFLTILGIPNEVILLLYVGAIVGTTFAYPVVGVKFEKIGESRPRAALGGVLPSILPWLVIWTMVFYMISPAIILAGPSYSEAADDLEAYLESNGIHVKVSSEYKQHLFAHRVIILGDKMSIPLGTNYGISAFSDAIQRFLEMERKKGTVTSQSVDSGEILTVKKLGRKIIIISGQRDTIDEITRENKEIIYNLLK
jgi:hypothetical protein